MEFTYHDKYKGSVRVNINAGDTWEYLGINNEYLNSIFNKIDDGKKDNNGYREVSAEELSLFEKIIQKNLWKPYFLKGMKKNLKFHWLFMNFRI